MALKGMKFPTEATVLSFSWFIIKHRVDISLNETLWKLNGGWDLLSACFLKLSLHSRHPLTQNTFHSSPMPSIWISNTNKSHLFGFVWAPPCCERWVGGVGQRILELLSQNIDGTEPVSMPPQPKTHVNVLQVTSWQLKHFYLFKREKLKYMLFFSIALILILEFHTVTPGRWRTTTAPCCWPRNSSHWTVGGWEPFSRAWWWWFREVSYSDFLSQVLSYSREYIFWPPVIGVSNL